MISQKLRFPPTTVKRSRDDKVDWLSEYVQNIERSAPNHAWIANTVNMDGKKVKKAMKAVNTADVSAAKGPAQSLPSRVTVALGVTLSDGGANCHKIK